MKLLQYIFLVAVSLPAGKVSPKMELCTLPRDSIKGSWKYIGQSGGFMGAKFKADPTKKTYIQFKDSTFISVMNGMKSCGTYQIMYSEDEVASQHSLLTFDHTLLKNTFLQKEDTLILTQQAPDGMSFWYIKCDTSFNACDI